MPTSDGAVHVHCAAVGLARPALRPIFACGRVTIQPFRLGYACYQFAMLGVLEEVSIGSRRRRATDRPVSCDADREHGWADSASSSRCERDTMARSTNRDASRSLMSHRRQRRHEQFAVQDLVPDPVVGQLLEIRNGPPGTRGHAGRRRSRITRRAPIVVLNARRSRSFARRSSYADHDAGHERYRARPTNGITSVNSPIVSSTSVEPRAHFNVNR